MSMPAYGSIDLSQLPFNSSNIPKYIPAIVHARIAGHEYKNVAPNRMHPNRMVSEQKNADGDVFGLLYLGRMHMITLNIKTTANERVKYVQ